MRSSMSIFDRRSVRNSSLNRIKSPFHGFAILYTLFSRKEAFENFRDETGNRTWSQQKFKKALAAYCENSDYIIQLDPPQLRKGSKRITRKINGVQREYFYIQTKDEVNETIKSSWC